MTRGRLLIISILVLSLAAALFSVGWHYVQTRRALEFWGPESAQLIANPDRVDALQLELSPAQDVRSVGDVVQVDEQLYWIVGQKQVKKAPGYVNARHALTLDRSFAWDDFPQDCTPTWRYALRFSCGDESVTVLFSFDCQWARTADQSRQISIAPIARGLEKLLVEQLGL